MIINDLSEAFVKQKRLSTFAALLLILTLISGYQSASAASCPNGTYKNTAGNCVKSPSKAPTWPAGASAKCFDGTYSYSQSRRGTCSHHGGVAIWH